MTRKGIFIFLLNRRGKMTEAERESMASARICHPENHPVARAPVLNRIQSTWLLDRQMPNVVGQFADVRGIIYDDVEPVGSRSAPLSIESRICLVALEDLNTLSGLNALGSVRSMPTIVP